MSAEKPESPAETPPKDDDKHGITERWGPDVPRARKEADKEQNESFCNVFSPAVTTIKTVNLQWSTQRKDKKKIKSDGTTTEDAEGSKKKGSQRRRKTEQETTEDGEEIDKKAEKDKKTGSRERLQVSKKKGSQRRRKTEQETTEDGEELDKKAEKDKKTGSRERLEVSKKKDSKRRGKTEESTKKPTSKRRTSESPAKRQSKSTVSKESVRSAASSTRRSPAKTPKKSASKESVRSAASSSRRSTAQTQKTSPPALTLPKSPAYPHEIDMTSKNFEVACRFLEILKRNNYAENSLPHEKNEKLRRFFEDGMTDQSNATLKLIAGAFDIILNTLPFRAGDLDTIIDEEIKEFMKNRREARQAMLDALIVRPEFLPLRWGGKAVVVPSSTDRPINKKGSDEEENAKPKPPKSE